MTGPSDDAAPTAPVDVQPFRLSELYATRRSKPLRELPRLLGRAVRLVLRADRRNAIVLALLGLAQSILTLLQLLLAQRLLSELVDVSEGASATALVPELVAFVVVFGAISAVALVDSQLRRVLGEQVARLAQSEVARAASAADLLDYERPGFHDRLQRSLSNAVSRPLETTFALVTLVFSGLTVVSVGVTLARVAPVLLPFIVLAFGPLWIVLRRFTRMNFDFTIAESEADRRRDYFLWMLTDKELATEMRAYQLVDAIDARHDALWAGRIDRLRELTRRRIRIGLVGRALNAVLLGGVLGLLVWMVSTDRADVSQAGVAAAAVFLLSQRLSSIVSSVGSLYESSLFLDDLDEFLTTTEATARKRPTADLPAGEGELRASGVGFRYPSASTDALHDIDLVVRPGEMIALVGANGSGKTTLAKILAGLMPPTSGELRWNGRSSTDVDPERWRNHVAMVFQDFARHWLTLAENVGFGRVDRLDDIDALTDAIGRAGADELVGSLPGGVQQLLGPQFIDGVDLSGGEWQRVALARAFFRDAPLLVLDEPSAALDAEAEASLFERVRVLREGRAVVVISHRFSTVTEADRIYVMRNGAIVEVGSHLELMAEDGLYARLFRMQAKRYIADADA